MKIKTITLLLVLAWQVVAADETAEHETLERNIERMLFHENRNSSLIDSSSEEEIKSFVYISKLSVICKNESLDFRKLSIDDIQFLLTKRKKYFFGDVADGIKFSTLEMLCVFIRLHSDKMKLRDTIYSIYIDLPTDLGKVNPWGHASFDGRGGYIGLLNECIVDMNDDAYLIKLLDELLEKKDEYRFDLLAKEIIYKKSGSKADVYLAEKSKNFEKKMKNQIELHRKNQAEWLETKRKNKDEN